MVNSHQVQVHLCYWHSRQIRYRCPYVLNVSRTVRTVNSLCCVLL